MYDRVLVLGYEINNLSINKEGLKIVDWKQPKNAIFNLRSYISQTGDVIAITELNGKIDSSTAIYFSFHGNVKNGNHMVTIAEGLNARSIDLLNTIGKQSLNQSPLHIHFWGCYSGTTAQYVTQLPKGSTIITHSHPNETSLTNFNNLNIERISSSKQKINAFQDYYSKLAIHSYCSSSFSYHDEKGGAQIFTFAPSLQDVANYPKETLNNGMNQFYDFCKTINKSEELEKSSNTALCNDYTEFRNAYFIQECLYTNSKIMIGLCKSNDEKYKELFKSQVHGLNLLYLYTCENKEEMVKLLLENTDIDINAQSNLGSTSLHIASQEASHGIVKLLLEKNAKIDIANNRGITALRNALITYYGDHKPLQPNKIKTMQLLLNYTSDSAWHSFCMNEINVEFSGLAISKSEESQKTILNGVKTFLSNPNNGTIRLPAFNLEDAQLCFAELIYSLYQIMCTKNNIKTSINVS